MANSTRSYEHSCSIAPQQDDEVANEGEDVVLFASWQRPMCLVLWAGYMENNYGHRWVAVGFVAWHVAVRHIIHAP